MMRRGIETSLLSSPTIYTTKVWKDINASVNFINKEFHKPKLYTIGISMGAGILL
jgi:predicted alpha/beta-fold hydrolase